MCTLACVIGMLGCPALNEAGKEAVKAVIKKWKYVRQYGMHVNNLRAELRHLEDTRAEIERKVGHARDRGEEIKNAVTHWQADAGRMENDVQELIGQVEARMHCFACSCPNIKWRYRLGKQAEEKIRDVKRLIEISHFEEISHPKPPPPELEFRYKKNYVNLDSRTPVFNEIIKALKDPSVNIVGIHGLGGVGKTTLAEQVSKEMRDGGTFKQVPLVAVSKDLNVKEIQSKLADRLDFKLDATVDEKGRASQLWHKLTNGEKYLVILDDIWKEVDTEAIGIPIKDGKTGCKVLLTSRKEDLMIRMEVDRSFSIAELPMPEAWTLFKKLTGNSIDESRPEICSLAYKVCEKCKGLPVAINALGAALKNEPVQAWENALDKLETYMITNIEGVDPSVWASLKLSYEMLWSSDAKSCFLLCCLYPEDSDISIEDLMRHCVARRLLSQNPRTVEKARNAVRTVVHSLKSASLLSYGYDENFVRIHDVIRDVGISIAFEEEAFLVDHGALRWPRNPINGPPYSAISFRPKKIERLPNELTCPQLHTLMFDSSNLSHLEVPDNFFNGMKQLVVLILARMHVPRLPLSLANLASLGMLCLEHCELADIAILGDLKTSIEVLSLRGSTIEALPQEIGQLTSLLLLDLRDCEKLKVIPQGIISNLFSLEELYLPDAFDQWEATEDNRQDTIVKMATLEELRCSLSTGQLTTLYIHIPNVMLLPKEGLKFENLKRFRISVGTSLSRYEKIPGTRVLKHKGSSLRNEFISLVDKAEALHLSGIEGLKKVLHDRGVGNGFRDLRYLKVMSCEDDLEYFIGEPKSSVRNHGLHPLQPFNRLSELFIENCKLKYLFSLSTARGLVNLERLEVRRCEIMEATVGFEGQKDENELIFSKLKILNLSDLPNLKSFYAENKKTRTSIGSSSAGAQPLFNEKVIFLVLEELTIEGLDNIIEIWDKQSIAAFEAKESFYQLTEISISDCNKLIHVYPYKMHPLLKNIKYQRVENCETMEGVVGFEGEVDEDGLTNDQVVCFSKLTSLTLDGLPKLVSFCFTEMGEAGTKEGNPTIHAQPLFNGKVIFPVLETLTIEGLGNIIEIWDKQSIAVFEAKESFCQLKYVVVEHCNKLMHVYPYKMLPLLKNIKYQRVANCVTMEGVVGFEDGLTNDQAVCFTKLTNLQLEKLPKLVSFCFTEIGEAGTKEGNPTIHAQPLFNGKVAFPALESLTIEMVPMITGIWTQQPLSKQEKEVESFSKLKSIQVSGCDQLEYVLPSYMLPQLHNLLELHIEGCKELEVIVSNKLKEKEATNNDILVFPQLNTLLLLDLDNLKGFCTETQLLFSHKVIFPVLESLRIEGLGNIIEIWDKQSIVAFEAKESFCQLKDVTVQDCNKLMHVYPYKMHPLLKNINLLYVENCETMKGVVGFEGELDKDGLANDQVCFRKLTRLHLEGLPKLVNFCFTEMGKAGTTEGNPTTHAQHLLSGKVALPALECLIIKELPKINEIWDKQPLLEPKKEAKSSCKLRLIDVKDCNQLVYVFPSYMLPQLQNLQTLVIANCMEMEVIISNKLKERKATNNDIILFAELKTVILQILPNLRRLCAETQLGFSNKDAFPVLEINTIEVARKAWWELLRPNNTSSIDPDLKFLVDGTSRKEESGTSSKDEDNNDRNKEEEEEEDEEEDVKNTDNNEGGGGGGEVKDEDEEEGGGGD